MMEGRKVRLGMRIAQSRPRQGTEERFCGERAAWGVEGAHALQVEEACIRHAQQKEMQPTFCIVLLVEPGATVPLW